MLNLLLIVVALALLFVALTDIFHTLFHPQGHGWWSSWIMKVSWSMFRWVGRRWRKALALAGASMFIITIGSWALMMWLGFAMLYMPMLDGSIGARIVDALYYSSAWLVTLSFQPPFEQSHRILRMMVAVEALFGLGMLTASISWILSTQPILRNRRAFAHEVLATLEGIRDEGGLHTIPASELATILAHFSERVLQMRSDLEHTPGAYYFHSDDERTSLPVQLPALITFAEEAAKRPEEAVQMRARELKRSLNDLADAVRESFIEEAPKVEEPRKTIQRWRKDHLRA